MNAEQMKRRDELVELIKEFDGDKKSEFIAKYPEIWYDCYDIIEGSRYHRMMINIVKAGYDTGYADAKSEIDELKKKFDRAIEITLQKLTSQIENATELHFENIKLKQKLAVAKKALVEYAKTYNSDKMPTQEQIEGDYDCGCCSLGSAGSRAFKALKEIE